MVGFLERWGKLVDLFIPKDCGPHHKNIVDSGIDVDFDMRFGRERSDEVTEIFTVMFGDPCATKFAAYRRKIRRGSSQAREVLL
jgi:hypothetical protein